MAITVPVLMLMVLLIIQFALWYHASAVAEAAAQEGVRSARVIEGTADSGQSRAAEFMVANAPSLVESTAVLSTRTNEIARVEVNGSLRSIVPFVQLSIHAEAESPIERFREDNR